MAFLPEVKVSTKENITLTQAGATGVVALMGTAQWGATNEVKTFSSYSNLIEYYKADKSGLSLVKGADLLYKNGTSVVKAIRVATGDVKASIALDGNSGVEAGVLTFEAVYSGEYGNNILITIESKGTGVIATITDGVVKERYTNGEAADGYTTNQSLADDINASSSLVSVTVKAGSETANLVDPISNAALTGGDNGTSSLAFTDYTTAFDNYLYNEDFDILVIPGISSDSDHATMVGKLDTRAANDKKYAVYITGVSKDEDTTTQKARTASSERLVLVSPSVKYTPSYGSQEILDGSYLACAIAGQVAKRDVEESITRKIVSVEGLSVNSTTGVEYYNNGEMEDLLTVGITPVSKINGAIKVARGVTRVSDKTSIYYELTIQRIVDYVKEQVQTTLDGYLGDPNLARVREGIARTVDGILQQDKLDEVIADYNPTEVLEGTSPDIVVVNMSFQPTFTVNFINVSMTISRV